MSNPYNIKSLEAFFVKERCSDTKAVTYRMRLGDMTKGDLSAHVDAYMKARKKHRARNQSITSQGEK